MSLKSLVKQKNKFLKVIINMNYYSMILLQNQSQ